MELTVGDRVESLINNSKIKAGEVGVVVRFDGYPGEEYPWSVELADGRSAAYNRFELKKVEN